MPRWSFDDFEEFDKAEVFRVELDDKPVSKMALVKRLLLSTLWLMICAFILGLIISSFCMGSYIAVDWFKEWIK